jgi:cytochrome o ubiquinol oxidase subunit IV
MSGSGSPFEALRCYAVVLTLGFAQMGVCLVFFPHISPDEINNLLALAFGIFVVSQIVLGSVNVMRNFNHATIPMNPLMRMQR